VKKGGEELAVNGIVLPRRSRELTVGALVLAVVDASRYICSIMDQMGIAAWLTDTEGNIEATSDSSFTLTQYTEEECIGKTFATDFIKELDSQKNAKRAIDAAVKGGFTALCANLVTKEGGEVAVSLDVCTRHVRGHVVGSLILARRDTESDLLGILQRLGVSAWCTDTDGMIDNCNENACAITEESKARVMGSLFIEDVVSTDKTDARDALSSAMSGKSTHDIEIKLLTKSKNEVHVNTDVAWRQRGKKINGSIVMARRCENMLAVYDKLGICAWYTDIEGKVTDCNITACNAIEYTRTETLSKILAEDFVSSTNNSDRKSTSTAIAAAVAKSAETAGLNINLLTKRQRDLVCEIDVFPRRAGEVIIGSLVLARKSDNMLEMLDKLEIPAWYTDKEGAIEDCNQTGCDTTEYSRQDLIGKILAPELIQLDDRDTISEAISSAGQGDTTTECNVKLISKSKRQLPVLTDLMPRRNVIQSITGDTATTDLLNLPSIYPLTDILTP